MRGVAAYRPALHHVLNPGGVQVNRLGTLTGVLACAFIVAGTCWLILIIGGQL